MTEAWEDRINFEIADGASIDEAVCKICDMARFTGAIIVARFAGIDLYVTPKHCMPTVILDEWWELYCERARQLLNKGTA